MSKTEKIGRPHIEESESGADIELGQPVLENEFEKETIEATFPVIKEAFDEFYARRINRDKTAFTLGVMRDRDADPLPYVIARAELMQKNSDATLALSIIESARGELQLARDITESYELESENAAKNQELETERQKNFEKDLHYQEVADILFNHDEYKIPEKSDFIEWLGETKKIIKKLAKEEEKKIRGEGEDESIGKRVFRSRLLTDIPSIERFETGRETTRDYREIMDVIQNRLFAERDKLGSFVAQLINDPKSGLKFKPEIVKSLAEIRTMELFLAMAEGERNERIAKKQP